MILTGPVMFSSPEELIVTREEFVVVATPPKVAVLERPEEVFPVVLVLMSRLAVALAGTYSVLAPGLPPT